MVEKVIVFDEIEDMQENEQLFYEIVSEIKEKYHHIKRVYVRAEFPVIDESYETYLLSRYEDTYFPEKLHHAGKAVYVERNFEMIDNSQYCLVYYDEVHAPTRRKSGTKIALEYARKQNKETRPFPKAVCLPFSEHNPADGRNIKFHRCPSKHFAAVVPESFSDPAPHVLNQTTLWLCQ